MKCLKCGYVTSESKETCVRCGSALPPPVGMRTPVRPRQHTPAPASVSATATPAAPEPPTEGVPDWRKEVSRKVKEYGEKKKILTTPPQPLKEKAENAAVEEQRSKAAEEQRSKGAEEQRSGGVEVAAETPEPQPAISRRSKVVTDASLRVEPVVTPDPPRETPSFAPAAVSVDPESRAIRPIPPLEEEIYAGDLNGEFRLQEEEELEGEAGPSLYLGQRAAALAVDSTILVALHLGLLYLCAEIISYNFRDLFAEAWLPLTVIFLLFHCLYYAYFYKTSRQTPGQVFFGIELRDPNSGNIPLGKVLTRWFGLVFLNVFNLVPVLLGHRYLLLDRISGTEIRTFK